MNTLPKNYRIDRVGRRWYLLREHQIKGQSWNEYISRHWFRFMAVWAAWRDEALDPATITFCRYPLADCQNSPAPGQPWCDGHLKMLTHKST